MAESIEKSTLWIIGGLLVGTITVTATAVSVFYNEYVTPLKIIESAQKIEHLTSQLDYKTQKELEITQELNSTKASLDLLKKKIEKIENLNLFSDANPYPLTLDEVRIGSPTSLIKKAFAPELVTNPNEAEGDFKFKVQTPNSMFSKIYYIYDESTKKVTSIVFELDQQRGFSQGFLRSLLTKSLGPPTLSRKKGYFRWDSSKHSSVYMLDDNMFFISGAGYQPALWKD